MLLFAIVAVAALGGLAVRQSALRFIAAGAGLPPGANGPAFRIGKYLAWLARRTKELWSWSTAKRAWTIVDGWAKAHYPGPLKWIFFALILALLYLAASGLFFGILIRPVFHRGMFGLPLLAHVMGGGLFALALVPALFLRARAYRFDAAETAPFEAFACLILKNVPKAFVRKVLFWAFAFLALVQASTALGSMLPLFTFETQQSMIMAHRYSALALVLTAVLFADITLLVQPDPPRT